MIGQRFLFTSRVVPASAGGGSGVAWRLLGGNNHELGRSAAAFDTFDACVEAVHDVRAHLDVLEPDVVTPDHGPHRGWQLRLGEEVVAVSARWYRRERECARGLEQFLSVAPVAEVGHVLGAPPPRRELLRPDFVLPHERPGRDDAGVLPHERPGRDEDALTQDLPRERVDELEGPLARSDGPTALPDGAALTEVS